MYETPDKFIADAQNGGSKTERK